MDNLLETNMLGTGVNRVRTVRPSLSKRRFKPAGLASPQTKQERVWGKVRISPISGCLSRAAS